jgi:hypothetical protein
MSHYRYIALFAPLGGLGRLLKKNHVKQAALGLCRLRRRLLAHKNAIL